MQTAIVDRGKHEGVGRVRVAFVYFASCGGKGGREDKRKRAWTLGRKRLT